MRLTEFPGNIYYSSRDFTEEEVRTKLDFPCFIYIKNENGQIYKHIAYNHNGEKSVGFYGDQSPDGILTIGDIATTSNNIIVKVHSSGENAVIIDGVKYTRTTPTAPMPYASVTGSDLKSLMIYALPTSQLFYLAEGIAGAEAVDPELPAGALFVRKITVSKDNQYVDTQATTGYKTIAEDGWKNIIIGNNSPYYIIATQANGSFNIMSRSSAPTISGITTKGGKYGWDGREFLFYNAAETPVRLGPGALPPDNPHAKSFIFREGLDYELKPHQYVRIKIIGDVLDVVTAIANEEVTLDFATQSEMENPTPPTTETKKVVSLFGLWKWWDKVKRKVNGITVSDIPNANNDINYGKNLVIRDNGDFGLEDRGTIVNKRNNANVNIWIGSVTQHNNATPKPSGLVFIHED